MGGLRKKIMDEKQIIAELKSQRDQLVDALEALDGITRSVLNVRGIPEDGSTGHSASVAILRARHSQEIGL